MSIRKLRAKLKELRSKVERQRQPIFVPVVRSETKDQALERMGIDPDDPAVDVLFIDLYPEEQAL